MPEWFSLTPIFQYKDRIFDIPVRENPYFGIFDTMMIIAKHLTISTQRYLHLDIK